MLTAPDFQQKQIVVAMISHGEKMSFKNDNLVITNEAGIKFQTTCYRLFTLFVVGHITVTTGLLQRAKKFGFSIVFLTHGLTPYGSWQAKTEGNVLLRRKQYTYGGTEIAQHIIANKVEQQIEVLQKRRDKSVELKEAIVQLQSYRARLPSVDLNFEQILGIEGIASRVYFQQMFNEIGWKGRKPRVKADIVNVLLDIGYTQLFNLIDALLNLYGFDTYQGVYHQTFFQRKSLVCDLVEPFRPLVDDCIRKAYNLNQIDNKHFDFTNGQYSLKISESKHYISLLLKSLLDNKQQIFIYIQTYYRAFMQSKPIENYPVFRLGITC